MLSNIGNIIIYGLGEREDRWQRCQEIIKAEGIENVTRYVTIQDHNDKHRHGARDLLDALRLKGSRDVVFFEDDFELTPGWQETFQRAYRDLPSGWDLFYLGANLTEAPERMTDNLVRVRGAWMCHAVVFRRKFIDFIFEQYDPNKIRAFDEWLRRQAVWSEFYMAFPMIAYQRAGYSDFAQRYTDYNIFENQFYRKYENSCTSSRLSSTT